MDRSPRAAGMAGAGGDAGAGGSAQTDTDGDGIADAVDNCPAVANPNQADGDGDRRGDDCDDNPTQADVILSGQIVLTGGRVVNDTHTLSGRVTTGAAKSENTQFIVEGRLSP